MAETGAGFQEGPLPVTCSEDNGIGRMDEATAVAGAKNLRMPFVSVVVPTRGRPGLLRKCLESLFRVDYPPDCFEVIVVEDGTHEGAAVVAAAQNKAPMYVRYISQSHRGLAAARNTGLEAARGEIVAYIDDDALAAVNWLREAVATLAEPRVGGVGGRVSPDHPDDGLEAQVREGGALGWSGFNAEIDGVKEVDFLPGGNMAFWRRVLFEAGMFDERFSKRGGWREETDLCLRVRDRGYRLLYNPRVKIQHRSARWQDPLERLRPIVVWCMVRDDAYFRVKNFGARGVAGTVVGGVRQARRRLFLGLLNLLLATVHLVAWVPGAARGLLARRARVAGARQ